MPRQVGQNCIRKLAEQASKQNSSVASASVPASGFLPCVPALTSLSDHDLGVIR